MTMYSDRTLQERIKQDAGRQEAPKTTLEVKIFPKKDQVLNDPYFDRTLEVRIEEETNARHIAQWMTRTSIGHWKQESSKTAIEANCKMDNLHIGRTFRRKSRASH